MSGGLVWLLLQVIVEGIKILGIEGLVVTGLNVGDEDNWSLNFFGADW